MKTRFIRWTGLSSPEPPAVNAGNFPGFGVVTRGARKILPAMTSARLLVLIVPSLLLGVVRPAAAPEAILVVTGDQHSSYAQSPRFVGLVDRLRELHPGVPLAVLLNGDTQEYGNVVARRSHGAADFALFAALARRVPTFLNLGNHDPEFYDVAETVRRVRATGVVPLGNLRARDGTLFAPPAVPLALGRHAAVLVGVTTDHLSNYRVPLRPELDLANPVVWAKERFPALLGAAPLSIVLSHAGLEADRAILPLLPRGTLFAGAHDHLRFVHEQDGVTYFHSGCWNSHASLAFLDRGSDGALRWKVEQVPIDARTPADAELEQRIAGLLAVHLQPEDRAVIAELPRELPALPAARFVTAALREAAQADAAFIGNTTFGGGFAAGPVTRFDLDACVRFDGAIFETEVAGDTLAALVAAANQSPATPWAERRGSFLVAAAPERIEAARRYRIVTTDWGAKNTRAYFGADLDWRERPGLKLKAIAREALAGASARAAGQ
jgi:5'-nucleotidase/UDP-sugar diphosphatase